MADRPGHRRDCRCRNCDGCPDCEEIRRLQLENQQLKEQLSAARNNAAGDSDGATNASEKCDKPDGQKKGAQAERTSRRNNSSQVQSAMSYDDCDDKKKSHSASVHPEGRACSPVSCGYSMDIGGSSSARALDPQDKGRAPAGVPLSELKKLPKCHVELEKLCYSKEHTVLINVDEFYKNSFIAQNGQQQWNSAFVKMPYSDENIVQSGILQRDSTRWEKIHKYLSRLPKSPSSHDIENAIKKYNPKYKDQWSFDALHAYFKFLLPNEREEASSILRRVAELALKLPHMCKKAIPMLRQGRSHAITLSQLQISCLLANAFYCTFPHRNTSHRSAEYSNYPTINFTSLFADASLRKREKFKALFNYFKTVTSSEQKPRGLITFERCYLHDPPKWRSVSSTLTNLHTSSEGTIEEKGVGMLQVDFACNLVGGGVLGNGLVQEEILFITHPELIVARLFTERLSDEECLKVTGCQQYSSCKGFSDSFLCTGPCADHTERDEWQRRHRKIVAIDALKFRSQKEQYNTRNVVRELNKAYCGFQRETEIPPDYLPAVATGNWGCGAFNGDPKLKALIQLMAAAVAQRDVGYFTFHNNHLESELLQVHHLLTARKVTVGQLFTMLEDYCTMNHSTREPDDLYRFIKNKTSNL